MGITEIIFGKPKPRNKKHKKKKQIFDEDEVEETTIPVQENVEKKHATMDDYVKLKINKQKNIENNDDEPNFGNDEEDINEEEIKEIKKIMKPKKVKIIKPKGKMFVNINKNNRVSLVISVLATIMGIFMFVGSFTNVNMASGSGIITAIGSIFIIYVCIKYFLYRLQVEVVEDEIFE
jgi:hypothetical protein